MCKELERNFIKKQSMDFLSELEKKYSFPKSILEKEKKSDRVERIGKWIDENVLKKCLEEKSSNSNSIDFIQIGRNIVEHLAILDLEDIHFVIIENQISPIANKMKTIQVMLAQYFILKNIPTIEFISSSNKLRDYLGETEKISEKKEVSKNPNKIENPNYKQHKKDGILYSRQWLQTAYFSEWQVFFDSFPKKQDDLADAFLQGVWYFRKRMGISLELTEK
jgi:hypothetical protein